MPAIAWAALCRITRLSRFSPARSVTAGIIAMSETSTKGATSPEASVETMSFGRPSGSRRMPAVTIEVPPPPPMPTTPAMSPRPAMKAAKAAPIAATAAPRSSSPSTASAPSGWCAATSAAVTSTGTCAARVPTSTLSTRAPAAAMASAR